jgi:hypothetical protein
MSESAWRLVSGEHTMFENKHSLLTVKWRMLEASSTPRASTAMASPSGGRCQQSAHTKRIEIPTKQQATKRWCLGNLSSSKPNAKLAGFEGSLGGPKLS